MRGRVPVVIMGETGCGKTSLIKFLAHTIGNIQFEHLDFHAGITEERILLGMRMKKGRGSFPVFFVFFFFFFDEEKES